MNLDTSSAAKRAEAANGYISGASNGRNSAGAPSAIKAQVRNLNFYYGNVHALKDINLDIAEKQVTALIGPSGCGKTTYLRCFNRMHDLYPHNRYQGEIVLNPEGINIIEPKIDPIEVRMRISMVFQKPNPFP
ncbi:MAG: ATP-binding cassette domain-containing protein, partial [Pseudomonadota bacterium]